MIANRASIAMNRRLAVLSAWVLHAVLTAVLWLWMVGVSALGFKDKAEWTAFDRLQAEFVPAAALAVSTPGRFILDAYPGAPALLAAWLGNSLLWALVVVWAYSVWKRIR
ncbi:hypothetical protein J2X90_006009 [Variovorax paradoxus]|nr:hypothetical protein [Variovorax paradoxus]